MRAVPVPCRWPAAMPIRPVSPPRSAARSSGSASPSSPITASIRRSIARAERDGARLLRAARRGEARLPCARHRRRARLYAVRHRDGQGCAGERPQGVLACRARTAAGPPLTPAAMPPNIWPDEVAGVPRRRSWRCSPRSTRRAGGCSPAIARHLGLARRLVRRRGGGRQFGAAAAPLSAGRRPMRRACAPARTRTSTSSPCCSAPRRRGWNCSTRDGDWLAVDAAAGRAGRQCRRHAPAADRRAAALDHPPRAQSGARAARALALFDAVLPALPRPIS